MLYKSDADKDIMTCLEDWPSAYYKEEDAFHRKDMLELAETQGVDDKALAIRKELWEKRYDEKNGGSFPADRFVRGIVIGKTIITTTNHFLGLGSRRSQKLLKSVMKDLLIDVYQESDEATKSIIRDEWSQLAGLYFKLCVEDKNFATGILSLFKLSDEELLGKIADEVLVIGYQVPLFMDVEEEFHDFALILKESYEKTFRNGEKILAPKIEKIMKEYKSNRQ